MPSASSLYAVSGSQLIKLIKPVTSLALKKKEKKEKSLLYSAFFSEKCRLKMTIIIVIFFYPNDQNSSTKIFKYPKTLSDL